MKAVLASASPSETNATFGISFPTRAFPQENFEKI
jgi:hypothetical protein